MIVLFSRSTSELSSSDLLLLILLGNAIFPPQDSAGGASTVSETAEDALQSQVHV